MKIGRNKPINDIFQFRKWPNSRFEDSLSCNICWFSLPVEKDWLMSVHNVFVLKKKQTNSITLWVRTCAHHLSIFKQPPDTLFAPGVPKISYYCEGRKHCLTRYLSWWYIMCTFYALQHEKFSWWSAFAVFSSLTSICISQFQFRPCGYRLHQ